MKVIFVNRKNCFSLRGGDTVQMEKTKEYLEKLFSDIDIEIVLSPEEILENNDAQIVHIFNITDTSENLNYIKAAKKKNMKVVLSTIYYESLDGVYARYLGALGIYGLNMPDIIKKIIICILNFCIMILTLFVPKYKNFAQNGLYLFPKNKNAGKFILKNSDIILPNSDIEQDNVSTYFGYDISNKTMIVPNATEFFKKNYDITENFDLVLPENFILEFGRIEVGKNQLNLIKALMKTPEIPIVIVGKMNNNHKYCKTVKKYAKKRGNVFLYDEIPYSEVHNFYKKASVHVLPSFMETTGLVTMEAMAMGIQFVTASAKYCPIKYYKFDEFGYQCDPYDIESIKQAVLKAYYHPKSTELSEEYKQFFSYENVAEMTYKAYKKVLEQ